MPTQTSESPGVGVGQPVRDALFPARRQAGGISTAAALHNLGEEAMTVNCRLMSGGIVLEEVEIFLGANGQEARYIEELFTGHRYVGLRGVGALHGARPVHRSGRGDRCRKPHLNDAAGGAGGPGGRWRPGNGSEFCAFRQWERHHLRSRFCECVHPAERPWALPLSRGHPSEQARPLLLRSGGSSH